MFGILKDETKKMARNPRRLRELFRPRRWRQLFHVLFFNARNGNQWQVAPDGAQLKQRSYASYGEYLDHQRSKFQYLDLAEYDRTYRRVLAERLKNISTLKKGATVLCLGARQGTEVQAFLDLGCFAVGIDLNPGVGNTLVIYGDFHNLQFPDGSVDAVFTNSFDHAFDPKKMLAEIQRVLKSDGLLITDAIHGEIQKVEPDHYASFWWQRIDDLVKLLEQSGFKTLQRTPFTTPWPGEQICLTKNTKT